MPKSLDTRLEVDHIAYILTTLWKKMRIDCYQFIEDQLLPFPGGKI